MSNLPNPEQILDKWYTPLHSIGDIAKLQILEAMKEYGRSLRDISLEWAAENATYTTMGTSDYSHTNIDEQSILKGKTHKDLEI